MLVNRSTEGLWRASGYLMRPMILSVNIHVAIRAVNTPVGGGIRSLNVSLRQTLDLYICLCPVRYFKGVPSPVKHPELVDTVIFRENAEDIYAGIEWEADSEGARRVIAFLEQEMGVKKIRFTEHCGIGVKPMSRQGTERLIKAACEYAIDHDRSSVTIVHKGNIMKFTEGGFKKWGYALAERDYGAKADEKGVVSFVNPKNWSQSSLKIALPMPSYKISCSIRKTMM